MAWYWIFFPCQLTWRCLTFPGIFFLGQFTMIHNSKMAEPFFEIIILERIYDTYVYIYELYIYVCNIYIHIYIVYIISYIHIIIYIQYIYIYMYTPSIMDQSWKAKTTGRCWSLPLPPESSGNASVPLGRTHSHWLINCGSPSDFFMASKIG